ncbi:Putative FAS1 domain-containing protein [Septoria linicola]|uniref:FAS1 domain-containing protein n=1 Tax=Septoria linicola TaxID=215465 RepID=A0A9Q9EJF4_9PEZI|nr:putative FAS1 domain-containing protein [Septoria linicola]USW53731.1 Putative FAS1 domain-containing protein [Septoria linicola]
MWFSVLHDRYRLALCVVLHVASVVASPLEQRASLAPVLTTIRDTPELSVFYSLFSSTGGDSGIPGPALEERFNDPNNDLSFTVFAPTNDAFANVSEATFAALTAQTSYALLHSLLINHIAPGNLDPSDLENGIRAIGGFDISFVAGDDIRTNAGVSNVADDIAGQARLVKGEDGRPTRIAASNGVVYLIDHVLDGMYTYFGSDVGSDGDTLPDVENRPGTMLDVLKGTPELSTLYDLWQDIDPDFLDRLSLSPEDSSMARNDVYLAPSNAAFDDLPEEALHKVRQPSNAELSEFLLGFGLGEFSEGEAVVKSVKSGFEISIHGDRANNARVEGRICAENGCVWVLRRWLDPLFDIF